MKYINLSNTTDILKIIVGNILITAAYAFITVPNEIINGGVTSFSLVLEVLSGVNIGIIVNIITIILLIVCLIFLGKEYFIKSILSSLCYMGFFNMFYNLPIEISINKYIGLVVAGILVGIGYYMCIWAKSSTVGFDIIALILNKKNEKINIAIAMRYINIVIILLGVFSYGIIAIILGVVFTLIQSTVLKLLLEGGIIDDN